MIDKALDVSYKMNKKTRRKKRTLSCKFCPRKFSKLCNGLDHARTHFKVKPYTCKHCDRGFTQRGNRERHEANGVCVRRLQRLGKIAIKADQAESSD